MEATHKGDPFRLLRQHYCRANRCWQSNNLRACLLICDDLTKKLTRLAAGEKRLERPPELTQLKHLVWFLKIRCLADDYYVNESLLLNEDDIDSEDQVRIFSATKQSGATSDVRPLTSIGGGSKKPTTGGALMEARNRTGVLTGRMPSVSSRQSSSRAASSYRPLTTGLTATQTAFSRSTRPLLKYSTGCFLSKLLFEYLYNAQTVTNKCPDYRQCLEYLNLVQNTARKLRQKKGATSGGHQQNAVGSDGSNAAAAAFLISTSDPIDERKALGTFWLLSFGMCYFNLHMNKEAEEYFQKAVVANPKHLDSYAWLVKVYLRSNQPARVLKVCEDALRHSKNAIMYNWMARIQSLIGDLYAANANLRESLKHYPTNIEALANVGHFAFYEDKLELALKCFERIRQLSALNDSTPGGFDNDNSQMGGNSSQLLNNLALCNFYCGFYHKVMPLFLRSFLNSPSKEVTANIWYNVSFVPMSCGFKNLAIACLRLALKNDSQNEEAINNLGVLKYGTLVNDQIHYANRQEIRPPPEPDAATTTSSPEAKVNQKTTKEEAAATGETGLRNLDDQKHYQALFDQAETYFGGSSSMTSVAGEDATDDATASVLCSQPEMLYNMALIKKQRGQLLASVKYCNLYLEHDQNSYHIREMMREIRQLVSHDC